MRILYVYDGDWPRGATRVAKQTRSLARAGHKVCLISRNELRQQRREDDEWMTVLRLPSVRPQLLNRALNFPYFFNPVWIASMWKAGRECRAECIIVADLPLALTAIWVGKALGVPVAYDMAEVYPEFLRGLWAFDAMKWSDYFIRNPNFAEWLERVVLTRVSRVFVVSEESQSRCYTLGVSSDRVTVVGNTPEEVESLVNPGTPPPEYAEFCNRQIILFVGILIGDRGVVNAVEAMKQVVQHAPDAILVVVGDGPERRRLEARVVELGLQNNVALLGWRQHADLARYYAYSHVGLLPFLDGSHVRITLANKLFDYMGAGLPVIASDLPPMRRIVDEAGAGMMVPPGDITSLASAITRMLQNEDDRRRMGANGQRAVVHKYRWSEDEKHFLSAVHSLLADSSSGGPRAATREAEIRVLST